MSVRVFTIPFDPKHNVFHDEELSKFLLNKQVRSLRPEFFQRNEEAFWTIFVEYECVLVEKFREANTLDGPERLLFQRLREWRREKFFVPEGQTRIAHRFNGGEQRQIGREVP